MTTTIPTLQEAAAARQLELAEAQRVFKETCDGINQRFADAIRREDKPITQLANELGMTRQTVHDILRRNPTA